MPSNLAGMAAPLGSLPLTPNGPLNLLSIDAGGGVRTLTQLIMLEQVMVGIQRRLDLTSPPKPCEVFHMICGSGAGGIVATLLGRFKLSVSEAMTLYSSLASAVYATSNRKPGSFLSGGSSGAFKATTLENHLVELVETLDFGSKMCDLDESGCECRNSKKKRRVSTWGVADELKADIEISATLEELKNESPRPNNDDSTQNKADSPPPVPEKNAMRNSVYMPQTTQSLKEQAEKIRETLKAEMTNGNHLSPTKFPPRAPGERNSLLSAVLSVTGSWQPNRPALSRKGSQVGRTSVTGSDHGVSSHHEDKERFESTKPKPNGHTNEHTNAHAVRGDDSSVAVAPTPEVSITTSSPTKNSCSCDGWRCLTLLTARRVVGRSEQAELFRSYANDCAPPPSPSIQSQAVIQLKSSNKSMRAKKHVPEPYSLLPSASSTSSSSSSSSHGCPVSNGIPATRPTSSGALVPLRKRASLGVIRPATVAASQHPASLTSLSTMSLSTAEKRSSALPVNLKTNGVQATPSITSTSSAPTNSVPSRHKASQDTSHQPPPGPHQSSADMSCELAPTTVPSHHSVAVADIPVRTTSARSSAPMPPQRLHRFEPLPGPPASGTLIWEAMRACAADPQLLKPFPLGVSGTVEEYVASSSACLSAVVASLSAKRQTPAPTQTPAATTSNTGVNGLMATPLIKEDGEDPVLNAVKEASGSSSNPALAMLHEAISVYGVQRRVGMLLSLGAGHPGVVVPPIGVTSPMSGANILSSTPTAGRTEGSSSSNGRKRAESRGGGHRSSGVKPLHTRQSLQNLAAVAAGGIAGSIRHSQYLLANATSAGGGGALGNSRYSKAFSNGSSSAPQGIATNVSGAGVGLHRMGWGLLGVANRAAFDSELTAQVVRRKVFGGGARKYGYARLNVVHGMGEIGVDHWGKEREVREATTAYLADWEVERTVDTVVRRLCGVGVGLSVAGGEGGSQKKGVVRANGAELELGRLLAEF